MLAISNIDAFQTEVGKWAATVFPSATTATIVAHMREELDEIQSATSAEQLGEEIADIVLLALHLAHRNRIVLSNALIRKFGICMARRWGSPDARGVVKHVEEAVQTNG